MRYFIMCKSLTYTQRAQRALDRCCISSGILKAPAGLTTRGCGYCVTVSDNHVEAAVSSLRAAGLPFGKVFGNYDDGSYKEVYL